MPITDESLNTMDDARQTAARNALTAESQELEPRQAERLAKTRKQQIGSSVSKATLGVTPDYETEAAREYRWSSGESLGGGE